MQRACLSQPAASGSGNEDCDNGSEAKSASQTFLSFPVPEAVLWWAKARSTSKEE